jgi:peptide/nickel transport system substrate-binding protein
MKEKIGSGQKITKKLIRFSKKVGEGSIEHVQENVVERLSHVHRVRLLILEWSLLVIAIIFLSITQAYWYSNSYAIRTFKRGGTYTEATLGEVKSLNPLFAQTNSEKALSKLMFASLSSPDYSGHSGLDLAKSIRSDSTSKKWIVTLRDNLKWSDGAPLTNEDVIFTTELIKNPLVNNNFSANLSSVDVFEEEGSIIFELASPNVYFDSALDFPILPKHALESVSPELILESNFSVKPITSGAYAYNATQNIGTSGEKVVYLVANDNYYKGRPLIDSFVVHAFMKSDDIVNALNNGTVTASGELTSEEAKRVNNNNFVEKQSGLNYGVYAFFDTAKELRTAIRKGIDMNLVREVLNGEQSLDFPIIAKQIDLEYPESPKYDFNAAKSEIAEILEKNTKLQAGLDIVTVDSGYLPAVTKAFVEQLDKLGIKTNVVVYDSDQDFVVNVLSQRQYDILIYEIGLGSDPDVFAYYHNSEATENGHNLSNYKNSVVSDSILSARATKNIDLRKKKYQFFLDYFMSDVPAIGIYQTNMNYFVNKNVRSYSSDNRLVTATDRFIDVNKWGVIQDVKNRTP